MSNEIWDLYNEISNDFSNKDVNDINKYVIEKDCDKSFKATGLKDKCFNCKESDFLIVNWLVRINY